MKKGENQAITNAPMHASLHAPSAAPNIIFDTLPGRWLLHRTIPGQATITGFATFQPHSSEVLHYRETCRIQLTHGPAFNGHRCYQFERASDGFSVFFDETPPRLFHCIPLTPHGDALIGTATHLCAPDRYDSSYRFHSDGTFVVQHTVSGPRKDYESTTVYRRAQPSND